MHTSTMIGGRTGTGVSRRGGLVGVSPPLTVSQFYYGYVLLKLSPPAQRQWGGVNGLNIEPSGSLSAKNSHR